MKKFLVVAITLALCSGSLLALDSSSAHAAVENPALVSLTAVSSQDTEFNAIATWSTRNRSACLYSASQVKTPNNSSEPWAASADCRIWEPPAGTPSGIYSATWDGGKSKALLVISADPTATHHKKILVLVPDFTWQAYDLVKHGNFYFEAVGKKSPNFSERKLNLLRPLNFLTVGDPVNYPTAPQLFPSVNPIAFLRKHFDTVDVVSETNLDEGDYQLSSYKTVVLYGHDEYWTAKIKSDLERAVNEGTSLLNLSGNTGYRKLVRTGDVIGFDATSIEHPRTSRWGDLPGDTSSVKLIGATYLGEPFGKRQAKPNRVSNGLFKALLRDGMPSSISKHKVHQFLNGMMVKNEQNPLFEGTGLKNGEFFGVESRVMSVELDGVPELEDGRIDPKFVLELGKSTVETAADAWVNARQGTKGPAWRVGQLIETQFGKGRVFTAGPIGWTFSLTSGDKNVERITLNALNYLAEEPIG